MERNNANVLADEKTDYKNLCLDYLSSHIDLVEVMLCLSQSKMQRCPVRQINHRLIDRLTDLMDDFGEDNGLSDGWWLEHGEVDEWLEDIVDANTPKF